MTPAYAFLEIFMNRIIGLILLVLFGSTCSCVSAQTHDCTGKCDYLQREFERCMDRAACLGPDPGVISFGTLGKQCLTSHRKEYRWFLPSGDFTNSWQVFIPLPTVEDENLLHPEGEFVRAEKWGNLWVVIWDPPEGFQDNSFVRFSTDYSDGKDPLKTTTYVVLLKKRDQL